MPDMIRPPPHLTQPKSATTAVSQLSKWIGTAGQAGLTLLAFLAIAYAPRSGQPVLAVPIDETGKAALIGAFSQPKTRILARAKWADGFIVSGWDRQFAQELLDNHIIILNANAPGCGQVQRAS